MCGEPEGGGAGRSRALASEIAPAASTSVQSVSAGLVVVSVYWNLPSE